MGEFSRAIGAASDIDWKGKKYKLAPQSLAEVVADWEEWYETRAWKSLWRQRKIFGDSFDARQDALNLAIASGDYSYYEPAAAKSRSKILMGPGFRHVLYLQLKHGNPGLDDSEVNRITDEIVEQLTEEIIKASLEKAAELSAESAAILQQIKKDGTFDPNSPSPPQQGGEESALKPSAPGLSASPSACPSETFASLPSTNS